MGAMKPFRPMGPHQPLKHWDPPESSLYGNRGFRSLKASRISGGPEATEISEVTRIPGAPREFQRLE